MKNCPHCNAEIEPGFQVCWNCNYSFTEKRVIEFTEHPDKKSLDCLRCNTRMLYTGNYKFHEGKRYGLFGSVFELFVNRESFDLYLCPRCGKVEFFVPDYEQDTPSFTATHT